MSGAFSGGSWLVTGGVGFIGYHVTRALVAAGARVTIVDDFCNAPYPLADKKRNEADLLAELGDRVTVEVGAVEDRERMRACYAKAAAAGPLTGVLHLAGLAGVRPSFDAPARYAQVNVEGTTTMLDLAREAGVARFVFASSSSVYGNSTPLPAKEEASAIEPESPYAASKRGAELVALALARRAPSMHVTALRFFTVYGPRQRPEMAITLFTRAALEGKPIVMFGDGSMKRDFTHVDDIVRGVLAACERAPVGFRAYNLGSGAPIRLGDLVTAIRTAVGVDFPVERKPVPLGDVDATFADISRAKSELGWSPEVKLVDGLRSVVDWVRPRR